MNTNHTPFPLLHIETKHTLYECVVLGPEENDASSIYFQGDLDSGKEIVRRCNSFPALLAALEGLLELNQLLRDARLMGRKSEITSRTGAVAFAEQQARAVIAQAKGETR